MALHVEIRKDLGSFVLDAGFETGAGVTGILGASGCGKSMTLGCIAGVIKPDAGRIELDGTVLFDSEKGINQRPQKRQVGLLFQNYALFRYMTVADNIAFGLEVQKKSKTEIKNRVEELLQLISMEELGSRYPHQLSGGQRQRVAFARALAPNPQLLLLDEPFAAIDAKVRRELRVWLKGMIEMVGITSIFVTHDQEEAMEVADTVIITNQGNVEQIGTPEEICMHPQTDFVADFIDATRCEAMVAAR